MAKRKKYKHALKKEKRKNKENNQFQEEMWDLILKLGLGTILSVLIIFLIVVIVPWDDYTLVLIIFIMIIVSVVGFISLIYFPSKKHRLFQKNRK